MIRQRVSGRVTSIYVRGWEPLGINGTYTTSTTNIDHIVNNNWRATNARNLNCNTRTKKHYVEQVGGWGNFKFNLTDVMNRIHAGWAEASDSFEPYSDIRFDWIKVYGVPTKYLDWVYYGSTHFPVTGQQSDNRAHWGHPLHLMLQKGRVFVPSLFRSRRKLFWRKLFRASSQFTTSFWDKTYFKTVDFFYFIWSFVDLELPSGAPQDDKLMKAIFNNYKNDWYKEKNKFKWLDRTKANKQQPETQDDISNGWGFLDTFWQSWSAFVEFSLSGVKSTLDKWFGNEVKHSPMCPPILFSKELVQAQIFYQIKFSATGRTLQSINPGTTWEIREPYGDDDCPKQPTTECSACLDLREISPGGTISSPAFARITALNNSHGLDGEKRRRDSEEEEDDQDTPRTKIRRCLQFIQQQLRK